MTLQAATIGLPVIDPPTVQETPDIDTSSDGYAQRFAGPIGAWLLQRQTSTVLSLIRPWPSTRILEVGGGHGQLTAALLEHGYHVTVLGSDERCGARVQSLSGPRCRFDTGNVIELPYPDRAFDVVISVRLLSHLTQWNRAVVHMARVAQAAVVVDYPTSQSLNCLTPVLFGAKRQVEGNTRTYRLFQDQELQTVFAAHGYVRRTRLPQFFWPMVVHRAMGRPRLSAALESLPRCVGLTRSFGSPVLASFVRQS